MTEKYFLNKNVKVLKQSSVNMLKINSCENNEYNDQNLATQFNLIG